jgi:hypothetical protein
MALHVHPPKAVHGRLQDDLMPFIILAQLRIFMDTLLLGFA